MVKPNFLIIGAMKSATTSLHHYLSSHPDICMSCVKEPGFFVEELNWNQGWNWYSDLFSHKPNAVAFGESSTHYTKFPVHQRVPARIAEHLPDVRFIYIMREPVSRALSHYWYAVHSMGETRHLEYAIRHDSSYRDFGRYALQIEQYLDFFAIDRFYFTTYERLILSAASVVDECCRFLGLDSRADLQLERQVYNATPSTVRQRRKLLHSVRWSNWWTRVAPYVPQGFKDTVKQYEYKSVPKDSRVSPQLRSELVKLYEEENERLFKLIGQRFEEWRRD